VTIQQTNTVKEGDLTIRRHQESLDMTGLDHLFRWASEVVSDAEDSRVRTAREKRIRRQVLEVLQSHREEKVRNESLDEIAYLQRRVIALLTKLQELTEENAAVKQIMVSQSFALEKLPRLEREVKQLKMVELEKEAAVTERRYLMDGIAKIKVERDYLEDLLTAVEEENMRLAKLFNEAKAEVERLKNRRWWHVFFAPKTAL
jgi:chromosome segregation ATPase